MIRPPPVLMLKSFFRHPPAKHLFNSSSLSAVFDTEAELMSQDNSQNYMSLEGSLLNPDLKDLQNFILSLPALHEFL